MIIVGGSDRLLNGLDLGSIVRMIIAVIKRKRAAGPRLRIDRRTCL